jgi:hypothetical protein
LREDVTAIKQQTQAVHNSETDGDSETDGGSEYMHIRKIILRTTMQGNQTCLSIKIPMPRCLLLPKTTVLSLALEQLIDLVGARQCEEEFRKSLYQLSSWTAAVWKTMDYSELKRSLGELVQRCKKLLVRNLPTSSSSTTLATSSPSTSTTRGDNAIDSESDEDTAAAPEMNRTLIGVPASATNMDQLYGIFPSEQAVKVSTWPFQHAQQNNSERDSYVAVAPAPRVESSVDAQWFSEVQQNWVDPMPVSFCNRVLD